MSKILFFIGRIKYKIWFLRTLKDGISSKWIITLFQEVIALGKNYRCTSMTDIKGVPIALPVQRSAESMEFVFKIRRRLITHNLMYLQSAWPDNDYHHNLPEVWTTLTLLSIKFFQFLRLHQVEPVLMV